MLHILRPKVPRFAKTVYCILTFIAIALDESIFLDVVHFAMKNIKSCDLEITHMGGATTKPANDVVCLLLLV